MILARHEVRAWAEIWHGDQKYGSNRPYIVHLDHVVSVMDRFGIDDPEILAAGYLHDVLEDTEITFCMLEERVGSNRVAQLVNAVTDSAEGKNRAARQKRALDLVPQVEGAILVKLADHIANVETCIQDSDKRFGMYKKEYPRFKEHLRAYFMGEGPPPTYEKMWRYLDYLLREGLL